MTSTGAFATPSVAAFPVAPGVPSVRRIYRPRNRGVSLLGVLLVPAHQVEVTTLVTASILCRSGNECQPEFLTRISNHRRILCPILKARPHSVRVLAVLPIRPLFVCDKKRLFAPPVFVIISWSDSASRPPIGVAFSLLVRADLADVYWQCFVLMRCRRLAPGSITFAKPCRPVADASCYFVVASGASASFATDVLKVRDGPYSFEGQIHATRTIGNTSPIVPDACRLRVSD